MSSQFVINNDLKQIVFDEIVNSATISIKSLKSLQTTDKFFESISTPMINIAKNKFTKRFCKERNITNFFKIIKNSLFDYNKINEILILIDNNQYSELQQYAIMDIETKITYEVNNNTFILFQFIKYCIIQQNKAELRDEITSIIDKPLFTFFDKVYDISRSKTINKKSITSSFSIPLDEDWYRISFNIYYIYFINRLYNDNVNVTMLHYKEFFKYNMVTDLETSKRNIRFVYHQYLKFEEEKTDNDFVYIASFMIFNIINELYSNHGNEVIKISYRDDDDIYHMRKEIRTIYKEFKEKLENKTGSKSRQILEYASK